MYSIITDRGKGNSTKNLQLLSFFSPRKILEQLNITYKTNLKNSIDIDFTYFMKINSISRPIVKYETKHLLEYNREENLDDTAFNDDFYV